MNKLTELSNNELSNINGAHGDNHLFGYTMQQKLDGNLEIG